MHKKRVYKYVNKMLIEINKNNFKFFLKIKSYFF